MSIFDVVNLLTFFGVGWLGWQALKESRKNYEVAVRNEAFSHVNSEVYGRLKRLRELLREETAVTIRFDQELAAFDEWLDGLAALPGGDS